VLIDWTGAGRGPRIVSLELMLFGATVSGDPSLEPDLSRIGAVIKGFHWVAQLGDAELDHLADAVRFRPLTIAAREFARSVRRGVVLTQRDWWSQYNLAVEIADRARIALRSGLSVTCRLDKGLVPSRCGASETGPTAQSLDP
jgi:Ser/Thr protein kinase RdoA (MazF antagonist)